MFDIYLNNSKSSIKYIYSNFFIWIISFIQKLKMHYQSQTMKERKKKKKDKNPHFHSLLHVSIKQWLSSLPNVSYSFIIILYFNISFVVMFFDT